MGINAHYQLKGSNTKVTKGATIVLADIGNGQALISSITNESVDELGIKAGGTVPVVVKASDVMIGADQMHALRIAACFAALAKAHSGVQGCRGIRKVHPFELSADPLIVQINGAPTRRLKRCDHAARIGAAVVWANRRLGIC